MEVYITWILLLGLAGLGAAWLPNLLRGWLVSFPMVYVAVGMVAFSLPLGLPFPNPLRYPALAERSSELLVIVALMGVGLKLDRPLSWSQWSSTWRLLIITMPLCIAAVAVLGWWWLPLTPAAAILLGAVLAPTDPVLAAEVQEPPPLEEGSSEVRFALTSESGLNDGLAFPFTNLALAIAAAGLTSGDWLWDWLWFDFGYKIAAGVVTGAVLGYLLAWLIFRTPATKRPLAHMGEGLAAIAITLVTYAVTELIHGYGFLGVFVAALTLRNFEREHEYHRAMHEVVESFENLLMAFILVLFGGAIAGGLFAPLTWPAVLLGVMLIFVLRPVFGMLAQVGWPTPLEQKAAIAFFGIRGVGSFYYLAHGISEFRFADAEFLWATVGFVVLLSIVVHGMSAPPIIRRIQQRVPQNENAGKDATS